ncbi:MAG: hypothetical protein A3G41_08960 [Elusimicrobia bacterium RIFCSPLOWO2_12_FULL_59_9]|nr:MAG: hypothetical protein A3G41_08960 [Elusimicrobia bacterium RIFCSPLOWO2_12_FULL_59_9]
MSRLLLLIPTASYRAAAFMDAARRLGVEVVVGTDQRQSLEFRSGGRLLTLDFKNPASGARQIARHALKNPLAAVVGVDEESLLLAAAASKALSLPHNAAAAIRAARDKALMRGLLKKAGVPSPDFKVFSAAGAPERFAGSVRYPCVLKPARLSASQGVIRADDAGQFISAFKRIGKILRGMSPDSKESQNFGRILAEDFIPGKEAALEGLLTGGKLRVLALFDKPDPLDGPFFEETIYVTPSRLPAAAQKQIARRAQEAVRALGLREGPVHAELRIPASGPKIIEIAARSIGGLCSKSLRFKAGMSLEELILRHALRAPMDSAERESLASGVMMIPIPRTGILREVRGRREALKLPGVEEISITIPAGHAVTALPEGRRYLGFIFARAKRPREAEAALRKAHARLRFEISPPEGASLAESHPAR